MCVLILEAQSVTPSRFRSRRPMTYVLLTGAVNWLQKSLSHLLPRFLVRVSRALKCTINIFRAISPLIGCHGDYRAEYSRLFSLPIPIPSPNLTPISTPKPNTNPDSSPIVRCISKCD